MPIINSRGSIISEKQLTSREEARLDWLRGLDFKYHEDIIFHLAPSDFRGWLYLKNPKEALLLCSTEGISNRLQKQMYPDRWKRTKDFVWRIFH